MALHGLVDYTMRMTILKILQLVIPSQKSLWLEFSLLFHWLTWELGKEHTRFTNFWNDICWPSEILTSLDIFDSKLNFDFLLSCCYVNIVMISYHFALVILFYFSCSVVVVLPNLWWIIVQPQGSSLRFMMRCWCSLSGSIIHVYVGWEHCIWIAPWAGIVPSLWSTSWD